MVARQHSVELVCVFHKNRRIVAELFEHCSDVFAAVDRRDLVGVLAIKVIIFFKRNDDVVTCGILICRYINDAVSHRIVYDKRRIFYTILQTQNIL